MTPSHVLRAMGLSLAECMASVRLSLGVTTTEADVDLALKILPDAIGQLRATA
jgi:cysteine desulfurase